MRNLIGSNRGKRPMPLFGELGARNGGENILPDFLKARPNTESNTDWRSHLCGHRAFSETRNDSRSGTRGLQPSSARMRCVE